MDEKCDVCGGKHGEHVNLRHKTNYNELYLTILRIGQSKVGTGLSYNNLIEELKKHGYDTSNDCVELAVKYWFFNSFYHLTDDNKPCSNIEDLDKHSNCNFILKGESSLVLLEHEDIERSAKVSRTATYIAIIALLISLLTITEIHDWFMSLFSELKNKI